ncbi:MAG: MarR family transcriptional regulator [Thermomicrobiales bacterium]
MQAGERGASLEEPDVYQQHEAAACARAAEDLGWALGTLLRAYLELAVPVFSELPAGARSFQTLAMVARGGCPNQAAIADQLGIDRTAMTHVLDDLEENGLVLRAPDPRDRRARRVTLTEAGVGSLSDLALQLRAIDSRLLAGLAGLDAAEAEALRAQIVRAANAVAAAD